jgi:hypothetical protein
MRSLKDQGQFVQAVTAPRSGPGTTTVTADPPGFSPPNDLVMALAGIDCVIIASGISDSQERDLNRLIGANATSVLTTFRAAVAAHVKRVVFISSAVVQGDLPQLNSAETTRPLTPYAVSKAMGESWLLQEKSEETQLCIYRPPSVHASGRRITKALARIARSNLACVGGDGSSPTPQVLISSATSAISFLASTDQTPPSIVAHPWEGLTCRSLLRALGGREPHQVPMPVISAALGSIRASGRIVPSVMPYYRRLDLLLLGQRVAPSWLSESGWLTPTRYTDWEELGAQLAFRSHGSQPASG